MSRRKNQEEDFDEIDEYSEDEDMDDLEEENIDDEEEDETKKLEKVVDWGKKKGNYYEEEEGKDSDEDKEEAEEEEAKLIEKLNNERLRTQDFFEVFGDQNLTKSKVGDEDDEDRELQTHRFIKSKLKEMEGLADSDKVNFLKKESPEMINIITEFKVYFNDVIISEASIKEIRLRLIPIIEYTKSNKNISKETINYLEIRFNLLSSLSVNLCFYILLKLNEKNVQDHPVINRILQVKQQLNGIAHIHKMLEPQFNKILRKLEASAEAKSSSLIPGINSNTNKSKSTDLGKSLTQPTQKKQVTSLSKNGSTSKNNVFEDYSSEEDSELDDQIGEEDDDESDDEEYYRQIKKLKEDKREKINNEKRAKVEEQFVDDPTHHIGEDDVRGINRKILKNKGLVRKRKKIDRNSRVKLRKKYEKAEYKLKTKGIHYRTDKGSYEGEHTGVKAGIIKSRKLKEM